MVVTVEHSRRGLISLSLTSPSGTTVQLLHPRKNDDSADGLQEWPFVSVGHWGENPHGTWKLEATSAGSSKDIKAAGVLKFVRLTAHGTRQDPLKDNAFIIDFLAAA
ncbi:convertase P-domain protein [Oesophagostomum dentatum]|uniref:Convertase P-domain protein n=1 Tax=Oesophagostomum dentatum TaxID=61180 RepID=A0A0B1RZ16_OESDE|nr:convertase P-domain protein [Oesophagostomum dentatum]